MFHPQFTSLPEDARAQVSFLVLDWMLGEDDMERWVGAVEPLSERPSIPADTEALRGAVASLAAARDPEGWAVLQADNDGQPVFVITRTGVRWVDRPSLDEHHFLVAAFRADEHGQPIPDAADKLQAMEDELVELVEPAGLFIARETVGGVRMLHVYTDSEDQNAGDRIARFAAAKKLQHTAAPDPGWREVRPFTG